MNPFFSISTIRVLLAATATSNSFSFRSSKTSLPCLINSIRFCSFRFVKSTLSHTSGYNLRSSNSAATRFCSASFSSYKVFTRLLTRSFCLSNASFNLSNAEAESSVFFPNMEKAVIAKLTTLNSIPSGFAAMEALKLLITNVNRCFALVNIPVVVAFPALANDSAFVAVTLVAIAAVSPRRSRVFKRIRVPFTFRSMLATSIAAASFCSAALNNSVLANSILATSSPWFALSKASFFFCNSISALANTRSFIANSSCWLANNSRMSVNFRRYAASSRAITSPRANDLVTKASFNVLSPASNA